MHTYNKTPVGIIYYNGKCKHMIFYAYCLN